MGENVIAGEREKECRGQGRRNEQSDERPTREKREEKERNENETVQEIKRCFPESLTV